MSAFCFRWSTSRWRISFLHSMVVYYPGPPLMGQGMFWNFAGCPTVCCYYFFWIMHYLHGLCVVYDNFFCVFCFTFFFRQYLPVQLWVSWNMPGICLPLPGLKVCTTTTGLWGLERNNVVIVSVLSVSVNYVKFWNVMWKSIVEHRLLNFFY